MKPKVYIVVLNYNSPFDTINCIESIRKITYDNYKIVIIDNASTDNSIELIKLHNGFDHLIESKFNYGYASGNNLGIKYAIENNAKYICILNNDTEVESNYLNILIDKLEEDDTIGMVGPCICDFDNHEKIQTLGADIDLYRGLALGKYKGEEYSSKRDLVINVDYLGGACFIVRASLLEKTGLIPENYFLFYEETEFCYKLKNKGHKLIAVATSKIYHKRSSTINKFNGLSYYFLNRNRVVFMRRNATPFQKFIFYLYLILETIGRIIVRKEPIGLLKCYQDGLVANKYEIDLQAIKKYIK